MTIDLCAGMTPEQKAYMTWCYAFKMRAPHDPMDLME
jgi:hypothetical protein